MYRLNKSLEVECELDLHMLHFDTQIIVEQRNRLLTVGNGQGAWRNDAEWPIIEL